MIVVADSGPLHYLILIEQTELLRRFFSEVLIPNEVAAELSRPTTPRIVSDWLAKAPPWLTIVFVAPEDIASVSASLDPGERAAIALAETARADLLLIDDRAGREEARRRRLRFTGMLGILRRAAEHGMIDVRDVLARLDTTNFYVDEALVARLFGRWLSE
jgi:predicted nucleic acid-binding protein